MLKFVSGFLAAIVFIAVAGYSYFALGFAPVATAAPPIPFETTLAKIGLEKAIAGHMPATVPMAASEENFIAGAKNYRTYCAMCHGLPGQPETAIGAGEFPKPPQLFKGKGVSDDPAGETYWKVANGIRLTGMPAFGKSLTDAQIWQMSLLLANSDKLPESVRTILNAPF